MRSIASADLHRPGLPSQFGPGRPVAEMASSSAPEDLLKILWNTTVAAGVATTWGTNRQARYTIRYRGAYQSSRKASTRARTNPGTVASAADY